MSLVDLREHVRLAEDEQLVAVHGDLGAAVLGVEDLVALLDIERTAAAVLLHLTVADGDHLALLGLLLRGVGEDDSARGCLLLLDCLHDQAVVKGLELHWHTSICGTSSGAKFSTALAL